MAKYLTNEQLGNVQISEEVVISLVSMAAAEVPGVVATGVKPKSSSWKDLITKGSFGKNVRVEMKDNKIDVDMDLTVMYGIPAAKIASDVQQAVMDSLTNYTGLTVGAVNVHICGITFPKTEEKKS